jgi:fluoroquinolone transport system permease protein
MKNLIKQIWWQFLILNRNKVILISTIITAMYVLLFLGLNQLWNMDKLLTFIILNDPAIIGLFFIGISILMEKKQEVLSAIFITPLNHHIYLLSRVISLTFLAYISALIMTIAVIWTDINFLHFSVWVIWISTLSCLIGVYIVSYSKEFLNFILKATPILLLFVNLPLLKYFWIIDSSLINIIPTSWAFDLIVVSYDSSFSSSILWLLYNYISIIFWISIFYYFAFKSFKNKIINT